MFFFFKCIVLSSSIFKMNYLNEKYLKLDNKKNIFGIKNNEERKKVFPWGQLHEIYNNSLSNNKISFNRRKYKKIGVKNQKISPKKLVNEKKDSHDDTSSSYFNKNYSNNNDYEINNANEEDTYLFDDELEELLEMFSD